MGSGINPNRPTLRRRSRPMSADDEDNEFVGSYCHLDYPDPQTVPEGTRWAHNDPFCAMCHSGLYAFCFNADATRGHDVREVGEGKYEIIYRGAVGIRSDAIEFRNSSWISSVGGCSCCIHVNDCLCSGVFFVFVDSFESYRFEGVDVIVVCNCHSRSI